MVSTSAVGSGASLKVVGSIRGACVGVIVVFAPSTPAANPCGITSAAINPPVAAALISFE